MTASNGSGQFAGKVAAITGGTQGVGEAVARLYVERGAAGLTLAGRTAARGEALAAELSDLGTPTVFVQADMANVADCQRFIDTTEQRFGRLDALVNCAADTGRARVENTTEEASRSKPEPNQVKAGLRRVEKELLGADAVDEALSVKERLERLVAATGEGSGRLDGICTSR